MQRSTMLEEEGTGVLPEPCPACDGPVFLEWINLNTETKTQTCTVCGLRFTAPIGAPEPSFSH